MESIAQISLTVNRSRRGKLPKDAGRDAWREYNRHFRPETLTPDELVSVVRDGFAISANVHKWRHRDNFVSRQEMSLDFDSGDQTLDELAEDPFVSRYAYAVNETSSHTPNAPRLRATFILDRPITDPDEYARYASALVRHFETSDENCTDPARLWFGAHGCNVRKLGNFLSVDVLDALADAYANETNKPDAHAHNEPTGTVQTASIADALAKLPAEWADDYGRWLRVGFALKHEYGDAAFELWDTFSRRSDKYAGPDATRRKWDSLKPDGRFTVGSIFYHAGVRTDRDIMLPDGRPMHVDAVLDALTCLSVTHAIPFAPGQRHVALKTFMGVLSIMRDAGSIADIALPVRTVAEVSGVPRSTVQRHFEDFVSVRFLEKVSRANFVRANTYSIGEGLLTLVQELADTVGQSAASGEPCKGNVPSCPAILGHAQTFHFLQREDACLPYARLHMKSPENGENVPHETLGPAVQQIVSFLSAREAFSLSDLARKTGVNKRTLRRKWRVLEHFGIVATETDPEDERRKIPALTDDWHERLVQLAPHLETFANGLLREDEACAQRETHHTRMLRYVTGEDAEIASLAAENASRKRQTVRRDLNHARDVRKRLGMPGPSLRRDRMRRRKIVLPVALYHPGHVSGIATEAQKRKVEEMELTAMLPELRRLAASVTPLTGEWSAA